MPLKLSMLWMVAGLALHVALAFVMGVRHERGQAAKRENAVLTRELWNARTATRELHEMAVSIQAEHIVSLERLNAIAHDFEVSREQYQTHFNRQRAALSGLLAKRLDLAAPAGADVVRHWQASNAGTGLALADTAPAADPGGTDAAVSAVADAGRGEVGGFAGEPRCGHGALPPVPDAAIPPDRRGEGMGADGATELLRGAHPRGAACGDMR